MEKKREIVTTYFSLTDKDQEKDFKLLKKAIKKSGIKAAKFCREALLEKTKQVLGK